MKQRITSIDIFRGLTIVLMILVNNPGTWSNVYAPLLHAEWHGYTPTDLVFPFFLFIVGISIALAYKNKEPGKSIYRKIVVRSVKLFLIGLFLGAFLLPPEFFKSWEAVRIFGVLQRIGLVFLFTALLAIHLNWKWLLGVAGTLLVGYWVWLGFIPLPDGAEPSFDRVPNNWALWIDSKILGSHMWKSDYDPEGLMSTIPAIGTSLLGVITGRFLLSDRSKKHLLLLGCGGALVLAGHIWSLHFPINKALWSSSFVLATAGWALITLALIYYFTDVKGQKLGGIFRYAGANALAIFTLNSFLAKCFYLIKVGDTSLKGWLFQTIYVQDFLPIKVSSLMYAITVTSFYLFLGWFLWRKKIFIKV